MRFINNLKVSGECDGIVDHFEESNTVEECHQFCKSNLGCRWFTFSPLTSACFLFQSCDSIDEECEECISGERRCSGGDLTSTSTITTATPSTTTPSTTSKIPTSN